MKTLCIDISIKELKHKEVDSYFIDENNRWITKKAFENLWEKVEGYSEQ